MIRTAATPTRPSSLVEFHICRNVCPPRKARHARTLLAPRNKTALSSREEEQARGAGTYADEEVDEAEHACNGRGRVAERERLHDRERSRTAVGE